MAGGVEREESSAMGRCQVSTREDEEWSRSDEADSPSIRVSSWAHQVAPLSSAMVEIATIFYTCGRRASKCDSAIKKGAMNHLSTRRTMLCDDGRNTSGQDPRANRSQACSFQSHLVHALTFIISAHVLPQTTAEEYRCIHVAGRT